MNVEHARVFSVRDAIEGGRNVTAELVVVNGEYAWAITQASKGNACD